MAQKTKHQEVSRRLRADIATGRFGTKGRLPGEPQLVKQFGVSRPTIARALLDLQNDGLIERRAGSGTYIRPQAPTPTSTRQIGLLIPGLGTTEIFEIICGELASLVRTSDYFLLWGGSTHPRGDQDSSRKHAIELCDQFIERRVTGVFFAPFELTSGQDETNRRIAQQFHEAGIPVVLLDRDLTGFPLRSDLDLVGLDNVAAGCILAEHLIKLECQRIAFVARPLSAPTVDARIAGVREAFVRHKIDPPRDWIQLGNPQEAKFVRALLAGRSWDAVICANDLTAAYFMQTAEQDHFHIPKDIRVVGFDDAKYASLVRVPLTTIQQPCRNIAITAFRAMLERIAEPALPARSLLLAPRLVVRESCGAYLTHTRA
jgi:LacI family transcriptional regulator